MNTRSCNNNNSQSFFFFLLLISLKSLHCNEVKRMTKINKKFVGRELKTYYHIDWLSCLKECSRHSECLSYNFQDNSERTRCDLYYEGVKPSCDAEPLLVHSRKTFFQQLRPSKKGRPEDKSPPRVLIEIRNEPKQIILECHVSAASRVTWYKDGQPVPSRSIRINNYIYLSDVTVTRGAGNYGNYTCTAITLFGKTSNYVILPKHLFYPEPAAVYALNRDRGVRDISGNNNPVGKLGMDMRLAPGPNGMENGSYQFSNHRSSYIEFPNNGGLDTRTSTTILIWLYIESNVTLSSIVSYVSRNRTKWGVTLLLKDNDPGILWESRHSDQDWMEVRHDKVKLSLHTWYYIAASYNYTSGVGSLWVDGWKLAEKVVGKYELNTQGSLFIEPFEGRVSCLQIYADALSGDMIDLVKNRCWT